MDGGPEQSGKPISTLVDAFLVDKISISSPDIGI